MAEPAERELAVFSEVRRLPAAERASYLERTCAGDEGLRQRVEELLRAAEEAADFLQDPAPGIERVAEDAASTNPPGEKAGDCIGRYKLLQQIGEGGCGVVFMAEQEEPVRRRVALKVIKLGMDTKSVIARFEAERQALAMMDHSNIAKVFDAGATEAGRPFFVMELVRGIKITYYCDQNNLSTRERLELFIQVCQAVQHAHQKGVIHRDIKPSNILVTARDGVPVPKVIDFGIAKATTDQPLTNKTLFTAFEQFLGTPAYMSPEQAEMSELGMDTRSDIYSLGVLLYELLTGHTPFDAAELLRAGIDSMRRTIRETDPPRPSTRLSTMLEADLTTAAKCRHSDPLKLIHLVRGDLDWIVMKCLEKDRMRRYETANGLATDVHRYLRNEPVVARPPSTAYRFQKLVRRNKLAFAAAAALSTMLVIGTVVSTLEAIRATSSEREQSRLRQAAQQAQASESKLRQKAEANEKRAESEALKSRQVASFLEEMLGSVDPAVARGRDTTLLRRILDRTADRVRHDLTNQVEVQAELLRVCGHVYWSIGEDLKSEAAYRQALAIQRTVFGKENAAVADTLFGLAQTLCYLRPKESEGYYRESLEIRRKLYGNENSLVAHCLNNITSPLLEQGKFAEAESFSREALAMERKLLSNDLAAAAGQTNSDLALAWKERALARGEDELAVSLRDLGIVLRSAAKLGEAESSLREGLALFRRVVGDRHPDVAFTLDALAKVLSDEGKLAEAEIAGREAMAIQRDVYRTESPALRNTFFGLIHILRKEGKLAEAESLTRELLAERRKLLGNDNPEVATFLGQLADLLKAEGRLVEAETAGREAFALKIKLSANDSSVAESLSRLIKQLMAQRKYADVEQLFREILPPSADDQPQSALLLPTRGGFFARRGRWKQAMADLSKSIAFRPSDRRTYDKLAAVLVASGESERYRQLCLQILERFGKPNSPDDADATAKDCLILPSLGLDLQPVAELADTAVRLGATDDLPWYQVAKALAEYRQGHFAGATDWAQRALSKAGEIPERDLEASAVLAMAHHRSDQIEQAAATLAKAVEMAEAKLPKLDSGDLGDLWIDWIIGQTLLSEAKALIRGQPPVH